MKAAITFVTTLLLFGLFFFGAQYLRNTYDILYKNPIIGFSLAVVYLIILYFIIKEFPEWLAAKLESKEKD